MEKPVIECERQHPILSAADLQATVDYYVNRLGFELGFLWGEPPRMAGVSLGDVQIFLRKDPPGPDGCSLVFMVNDADALCEYQRANGVEIVEEPGDREYGVRDYMVRDPNGYELVFGHYIYTMGEPVEIERVDVPVRLERRLAALLQDLADHKKMSVSGCLEEMLLHTMDGVGPHTASQLRHIESMKKKHGIDYDTHASYRFRERSS